MPAFVAPQLCGLVDRPPEGENWVHEAKFDGYRMQIRIERASAALRTRKGLDWSGQPLSSRKDLLAALVKRHRLQGLTRRQTLPLGRCGKGNGCARG
jgi:ATP-dependent DNA ligase